jgi:hypothetical protein
VAAGASKTAFGEPVDHFLQPRQRGILGMLGHHAGRAVELQNETNGDVRRDGRRTERVEGGAGGAREQLAMASEPRRTRRDGVEYLLGHGQLGGFQRRRQRVQRLALVGSFHPFHGVRPSPRMA